MKPLFNFLVDNPGTNMDTHMISTSSFKLMLNLNYEYSLLFVFSFNSSSRNHS